MGWDIEIIFSYPGLGYLMYEALLFRDYAVIQGVLLLVATIVLAVNFLVDLSYTKVDPRVEYAR
jgi:peptide/nickel transport system permease protein